MKVSEPIGTLRPRVGSENCVEGEDRSGEAERGELLEKRGSAVWHAGDTIERYEAYSETLVRDFFFETFVLLNDFDDRIGAAGGSEAADDNLVDLGLAAEIKIGGVALEIGDEQV